MKSKRFQYFIIILIVIALGIISRKITILPLYMGDFFYAMMIYFIIRMLFLSQQLSYVVAFSLALCYLIEYSQLYQAHWIIEIRKTFLGRYMLGQGFLWSDLIAYFFGITTALSLDRKIKNQSKSNKIVPAKNQNLF
jgi:hypothetical protein